MKPVVKGAIVTGLDLFLIQGGNMSTDRLVASGTIGVVSTIAYGISQLLIDNNLVPHANVIPYINDAEWEDRIVEFGIGAGSIVALNELGNYMNLTTTPKPFGVYSNQMFEKRDLKKTLGIFVAGDILGEYIMKGM